MYKILIWQSTANKSVLKAISSYKNSAAQARMHSFQDNPEEIQARKKQINIKSILKDSQSCIMIRQYLFQQEKPAISVNYSKRFVLPVGKWTIKQLEDFYEKSENKKVSQSANNEAEIIQEMFQGQLRQKFLAYYERMGKKGYNISVVEEVEKVAQMTDQQFDEYIKTLETQA